MTGRAQTLQVPAHAAEPAVKPVYGVADWSMFQVVDVDFVGILPK